MKIVTLSICTLAALGLLAGCTTPKTVMKHPKTGQVVSCGGSATGSFVGGVVGYHVQKSNESECVADYAEQGFETIKVTE
jgi:uncharacterized lipoprotein YajG